MANPVYRTYTTTGEKDPIALNYYQTPFNATAGVWLVSSATATFGVEFTLDDPQSASARWYDDPTLGPTSNADGVTSYLFPVTAVRLNISAISGSVEFKVLQGMPAV